MHSHFCIAHPVIPAADPAIPKKKSCQLTTTACLNTSAHPQHLLSHLLLVCCCGCNRSTYLIKKARRGPGHCIRCRETRVTTVRVTSLLESTCSYVFAILFAVLTIACCCLTCCHHFLTLFCSLCGALLSFKHPGRSCCTTNSRRPCLLTTSHAFPTTNPALQNPFCQSVRGLVSFHYPSF